MKALVYKIGEQVEIVGIGYGKIMNIRYDARDHAIYSVWLDGGDRDIFVARHSELRKVDNE